MPEKKDEKKAPGIRKDLRCKVVPEASSEHDKVDSSHEGEEEEEEDAPSGKDEGSGEADPGAGKGPRCRAVIPLSSEGIRKRSYLPPPGREEEESHPRREGWGVQEGEGPTSGLLRHGRSQRGGVATQGESPSAIVSVCILS